MKNRPIYIVVGSFIASAVVISGFLYKSQLASLAYSVIEYRNSTLQSHNNDAISPTPAVIPTLAEQSITARPTLAKKSSQQNPDEWGVAKKVDEGTYTIQVGYDSTMTTPQEALTALNNYRQVNGKSPLEWSDSLGVYAQERANSFESAGGTDKHAGFSSYLENSDGFNKLGFRKVGENSYFGGPLSGVHLVEWVFSQSPGHNANQLDSGWTHAGVGVTNRAVNYIFAGEKM